MAICSYLSKTTFGWFLIMVPPVGISPSTQNLFSQQILVWAPAHGNFLLKISHSAVRFLRAKQEIALLDSTKILRISCVFIVPSSNLFPKQMIRRKPHALASTPATPKEKCLLLFWFGGGEIFLEKGKDIFLWGSALQVFGQCMGLQYGLGKTKICFSEGKDFSFCLG